MPTEPSSQPDKPSQAVRDRFAASIEAGDVTSVERLLLDEPLLANADLRVAEDRDRFTNGLPLLRAFQQKHDELAELLLKHGAHPDAPGSDPDDQPELGLPLHVAAAEHRNYRLANVLLDCGATPNSYPNCDKATIERMFYQAREAGLSESIVRRAYAQYLPDRDELESISVAELVNSEMAATIKLFLRMVGLGAQSPFTAIVREGFDDLAMEIVEHCRHEDGTPHDHPNSKVLNNIAGAARWYGYPKLVRRLMGHSSYRYCYDSAIGTIGVAIASHNRDGGYADYREIIVMQLEEIESHDDLEKAKQDPSFHPLHKIATDFTWHENYGYRADIAQPECYIDLAELFVSRGLGDINYRDPNTNHSTLSAAVKRGHHPGIGTYVQWLLENGANLRESDPAEVNPIAIAAEKGFDEIRQLLVAYGRS